MSLRRALLFRLLGPVALLLILSSVLAYQLTRHYANTIYDSWLYDIAHTVSLEVGEDGPEVVHVDEVEQQLKTWKTGDHDYYSISVAGRLIAGDAGLPPTPARVQRFAADATVYDARRNGVDLRLMILQVPASDQHPALEIKVAQDQRVRYELADEILDAVAIPSILLLLIAVPLIGVVVRGSLKGIDVLSARLARHPEGAPLDIDPASLPEELRELSLAFAGVVERNNTLLKAQRQFVANAAHQLRSPMAATQLHLDGVARAGSEAERHRSLSQLRRSVERSNRLANQLLSLARLEPGTRLPIAMAVVDLAETAQAAGADYVPLALNRGIDLTLDVPPAPVRVLGHALLLQEALSNLIDNAVRYHPGEGRIELGVAVQDGRAVVTVSDDGRGVAAEFAGQLFTRFARSDEGRGDGAGLGLAIVSEIVELHHGQVRAEAGREGRGLCIRLEFPLLAEPAAAAA